MRNAIPLFALPALLVLAPAPALAQLELPRPSPSARVTQTVGLTEITVEYSSPAVKGRPIWGALVPYDELWRTGANAATKVTFSKEVTVGGAKLPAGSYSLLTIPTKGAWTVVLNKNATASTREYKKEQDAVRVEVKPAAIPHRERMTFLFADTGDEGTSLDLEWEKMRVSLPIKVDTAAQAAANIKAMSDGAWRPWNSAARYMLETKKDYDAGLALVEKSLALKEEWLNLWTKAQLLAAKGKVKEAYPIAEKANALGQKAEVFFFADEVKRALADWKAKK
jgi:hypothetical protein